MNWSNTEQSLPYVEDCYNSASAATIPAHESFSHHSPPTTQPRVNRAQTHLQDQNTRKRAGLEKKESPTQAQGLGLYFKIAKPSNQDFLSTHKSQENHRKLARQKSAHSLKNIRLPTKVPSTPHSVSSKSSYTSTNFDTNTCSSHKVQTPSASFAQPQSTNMTQRRMSSHGQRPVMGPPETPSRGVIPQSPGLFPNMPFSPDFFSQQMMDPNSAPVYPQQRLFWDPTTATPLSSTPQQFHTPTAFPDDFISSFNSNSTIVPPNFMVSSQEMPYDLPSASQSMSMSFNDGSSFPAPFQTSPRFVSSQPDNPTLFLSSPARRFGGEPQNNNMSVRNQPPELPAYHHQIQETKREKELAKERRKSRSTRKSQDDDLVMKSVRRALSPAKLPRPAMQKSHTYAGIQSLGRKRTIDDSISVGSNTSSRSTRGGRSSPLRQVRDFSRRSSAAGTLRRQSSMSLSIDENGVARTIMNAVPEDGDMDVDKDDDEDDLTDQLTSEDENNDQILYSFSGDPYSINDSRSVSSFSHNDAREELRSQTYLSMGSDKVARVSKKPARLDTRLHDRDQQSTIRRPRAETLTSTNTDTTGGGNAQQALRAIIQDRSRSASSHASNSNSHSSVQFHSSPPVQPGKLPGYGSYSGYNASPTTITDPDIDTGLATPSTGTDADSLGSNGTLRCVCGSPSPDGNIMIQCDSCSKWLHAKCIGLNNRNIPEVYICVFCERTPMRGTSTIRRSTFNSAQSPLAHKSYRR